MCVFLHNACLMLSKHFQQVLDHRILVLGTQKLRELRDKIVCLNDYFSLTEESELPSSSNLHEEPPSDGPANTSKSAFFFINNTFYNDMRDPEAKDTSGLASRPHIPTPHLCHSICQLDILFLLFL